MSDTNEHTHSESLAALTLGSLGVVFGDIGTSPLYTVSECFGPHGVRPEPEAILGVLSLVFWSLMLVVTFKYVAVLMNADNQGEGGIMALLSLVAPEKRRILGGRLGGVSLLVIAGAALLFGDGIITPAISVLSAIEGLGTVDTRLSALVVPITLVILIFLFVIQSRGTGALGKLFGPVMVLWFASIGALGAMSIYQSPEILWALSPHHAVRFFLQHGLHAIAMLGSVVLAVTGGEALYADMGHFGKRPIRLSWMGMVLPCLLLSYLGQGALLFRQPGLAPTAFYSLVGSPGLRMAMVLLAAAATVIASQALISAVFSLTQQAVRMGYFPRLQIFHTSHTMEGQIYVPLVNWSLAIACLVLVLLFRESAKLAGAYGLAVSGTMGITSVVFYSAARHTWKWSSLQAGLIVALFLSFDIPFFLGTCVKFFEGGYIPFAVGLALFLVMVIWCQGRSLVVEHLQQKRRPLRFLLDHLQNPAYHRTATLGVYLSSSPEGLPPVMVEQMRRFESLPGELILLSITTENVPYADESRRLTVEAIAGQSLDVPEPGEGEGPSSPPPVPPPLLYRVIGHYGFMENPDVPVLLNLAHSQLNLRTPLSEAVYFIGKESFAATDRNKMDRTRESFFALLSRNAQDVSLSFNLPPEQVVELGSRVDL